VSSLDLAGSPLAPGRSPVRIHYRDIGSGPPIVFLHGGWGYETYAIDRQIAALSGDHRFIVPDRTGYGRSEPIDSFPIDFHRRAMEETRAVIASLGLDRPIVWGHSDGAIIALLLALRVPDAVTGVIAEATHFYFRKPGSRPFFDGVVERRASLGDTLVSVLERDHGRRWPTLLADQARAWVALADAAPADDADFYEGHVGDIAVPVLVIHGARDPRTEPGELDALVAALRSGSNHPPELHILPEGGHSPHSERATADQVTDLVAEFARRVQRDSLSDPAYPARPAFPADK